jgi:hypothetical protein
VLSFKRLEKLFGFLLPPASREHVLGDLHERCKSRREYLSDAISVLGPVIIGRIRRTTDFQVFLMETFSVYLSFAAAAWWLGQKSFLYEHSGFVRLVVPTTVTVIGLLLCNAYADPRKQSSLIRPVLESAGSAALAFAGQTVLFDMGAEFTVPFGVMLYGSCVGVALVSTLRMLFPPIFINRPTAAIRTEPRIPQTRDLTPARAPFRQIRRMVREVPSPPRFKTAAMYAAALVVIAVLGPTIFQGGLPNPRFAILAVVFLLVIFQIRPRE